MAPVNGEASEEMAGNRQPYNACAGFKVPSDGVAPGALSVPCALTIAGSDSSGGAGIQADIKTMTALGVYAESVITALTAQNTGGVQGVAATDPVFVTEQIESVFNDIVPHAVKIGMLPNAEVVHAVAEGLRRWQARFVVLDPVMVATSGAALSEDAAVQALVRELMPLAWVVTPNIPEAEVLAGRSIHSKADIEGAARAIIEQGAHAVLIKGGHLAEGADDYLLVSDGSYSAALATHPKVQTEGIWLCGERIATENTHGTGCTLSSAIASYAARMIVGIDSCGGSADAPDTLVEAVSRAKGYLSGALEHDLGIGHGNGPVNHMWRFANRLW